MQGHSERALSFVVRRNKIKREFLILDLHKLLDFAISGLLTRALYFFFGFFFVRFFPMESTDHCLH